MATPPYICTGASLTGGEPASGCQWLKRGGRRFNGGMVSFAQLLGFTLAALVIIVIPGPGVLFVVGRALSHGRRTAVATAAGHAAGNYVVAACVAVGLGSLLQHSAPVFTVVKLAGALYLVYIGVQAFRHRHALAVALSAFSWRTPLPCLWLSAAPDLASPGSAGPCCRLWRRLWRSRLSPFRLGLAAAEGPRDSCRDLLRRRRML